MNQPSQNQMETTRFLLSSLQSRTIPTTVDISVWYCSICASSIHEREKYDPSGLSVAGSYPGGGTKNKKTLLKRATHQYQQTLVHILTTLASVSVPPSWRTLQPSSIPRDLGTFWWHWQCVRATLLMPDPEPISIPKDTGIFWWHWQCVRAPRSCRTLNQTLISSTDNQSFTEQSILPL
jgi:hypothetical protein